MTAKTYQSQTEAMQAITTGLDVPPTYAWDIIEKAITYGTQAFRYPKGSAKLVFSSGVFTLSTADISL